MRRVLLLPRVAQAFTDPFRTANVHIGGCREAHRFGNRTKAEDTEKAFAISEKKRRRRAANARLRAWAVNEDSRSYVSDDLSERRTVRKTPLSAEEQWRRHMGKATARQSSKRANGGEVSDAALQHQLCTSCAQIRVALERC